MAPALVNQSRGNGNSGTSASVTIPSTTAGNLLVMSVHAEQNPGAITFTPPSGWTQLGTTLDDAIYIEISSALYYRANIPSGITSVAVTMSAAPSGWQIDVCEYSGVAATSPSDGSNSATPNNTTTPSSGSITTTAAGDLVIGFALVDIIRAAVTVTQPSGWTALTTNSDAGGWGSLYGAYQVQSAAGSIQYNPTFSISGMDANMFVAAFKAASSPTRSVPTTISAGGLPRSVSTTIATQQVNITRSVPSKAVTRGIRQMPLISQGVPAYSNGDPSYPPGNANDANEATAYRSTTVPSVAVPQWLAYDLSGVASAARAQIVVNLINQQGQYYNTTTANAVSLFADYKLQGNTAAGGGAAPTTGWVDLVTVTGNLYPQRVHALNLSGYNWLRFSCTASNGTAPNNDVLLQMDVHDASVKSESQVLILGDSISMEYSGVHNIDGTVWGYGGSLRKILASRLLNTDYPVVIDGGVGGVTWSYADTNIANLLANFAGRVVVLAYGTNDCNQSFAFTAGDTNITNIYTHILAVVDACITAGLTIVIPKTPWGSANAGNLGTNANLLNQYVAAHLPTDRPSVFIGPDFWTFFNNNQTLIRDGIHPTYVESGGARSGYEAILDMYGYWMTSNLWMGAMRQVPTTIATVGVNRVVPTTLAALATKTRSVPTTIDTGVFNVTRSVTTSIGTFLTSVRSVATTVALQALGVTRSVPSTVATFISPTRSVPTSIANLASLTRSVPTTVATLANRFLPTTVAAGLTSQRSLPTSVAILVTGVTRSVPTTIATTNLAAWGQPGSVTMGNSTPGAVVVANATR